MQSRIRRHILFWITVIAVLTFYFGQKGGDYNQSFFFVTMLLPVCMGTVYIFNYLLVPNFLLTERYVKFSIYSIYTLVFSAYFQMLVIVVSFIVLGNYQYDKMNPLTVDIMAITIVMYLVVLAFGFFKLLKSFNELKKSKEDLVDNIKKNEKKVLTIVSERKQIPIEMDDILLIESLSDYVKIHTVESSHITKQKISNLAAELPNQFIRIHRSFLINKNKIESFSKENIKINQQQYPISRTYKKQVLDVLEK